MKQVKLKALLMALCLLICLFLPACSGGSNSGIYGDSADSNTAAGDNDASGDPSANDTGSGDSSGSVIIGSTFTLSGPVAHAGQMTLEGAELAIKYVNEELGGINGRMVELKYYDDEFDETKIPMLYERLITQDKVDFLLSPYTSPFLAAAPVVDKYDQLMFCIAADSYVANDAYGQCIVNIQMDDVWRGGMWWHDVAEFFVAFDTWNTKGLPKPQTIAIVNLEISYGHEIADSVIPFFNNNGINVIYNEFFDPMMSEWTPVVSRLKELKPDIVFVPHYFEGCVSFVEKCKELDYYTDYIIVEGMSWDPLSWCNREFGGLDPGVAKRGFFGYAVYKEAYESESKDYLGDYTLKKYNSIPGNDLICGFMAVELAAKAANLAGSIEKAAMIKAMVDNEFILAGYPYSMNDTGGNKAEFHWGVGQYIPEDINNANTSGSDWYCVWPQQFANHEPAFPFPGWN